MMHTQARAAVNDVANHQPPIKPFLYWGSKPEWDCAALLFKRCSILRQHAASQAPNQLAMRFGHDVKKVAQAEK